MDGGSSGDPPDFMAQQDECLGPAPTDGAGPRPGFSAQVMWGPGALGCFVLLLAGCQSLGAEQDSSVAGRVNPTIEAGLAGTVSVEILELVESQAGPEYELRLTLSQAEEVAALVAALDMDLPLQPTARCIPLYHLVFRLADGRAEEFVYSCEDGQAFLGGSQTFWNLQQVTPPQKFQELMREQVTR